MNSEMECIMNAVIVCVLLNLVVPQVLKPFATPEELNPPNGSDKLSLKSLLVHKFVRRAEVPVESSITIALVVASSIYLGYLLKPMKYLK
jgi:hypothetical protein